MKITRSKLRWFAMVTVVILTITGCASSGPSEAEVGNMIATAISDHDREINSGQREADRVNGGSMEERILALTNELHSTQNTLSLHDQILGDQIAEIQSNLDWVKQVDPSLSDTAIEVLEDENLTNEDVEQQSAEACNKYRNDPSFLDGLPDGFIFGGDCLPGHYWGAMYPSQDVYTIVSPTNVTIKDGEWKAEVPFDENWNGISATLRHPAYPDALTLEELSELANGTVVCRRHGNTGLSEYSFAELLLTVHPSGYVSPGWRGGDSQTWAWSLEDDGVIPYADEDSNFSGSWSAARLTIGAC